MKESMFNFSSLIVGAGIIAVVGVVVAIGIVTTPVRMASVHYDVYCMHSVSGEVYLGRSAMRPYQQGNWLTISGQNINVKNCDRVVVKEVESPD